FEDTLDEALDELFGGDSGASAGDGDVEPTEPGVVPEEPTEPGEQPEEPTEPTEPGTMSPELRAALQDAAQALRDREAAYAANDLVAAAQADQRLQSALERAIALSE